MEPSEKTLRALLPCVVIGTDGTLGRAWHELLTKRGLDFHGPRGGSDAGAIDLREPASIAQHIAEGTRTVINCAAWTDVDGAESNEEAAYALNAQGVAALAERCKAVSATLLHYSTDYVFNGRSAAPYPVDQPLEPINAYGR